MFVDLKASAGLKKKLTSEAELHIFKQGSKFELHTHASSYGIGSVLLQIGDDVPNPAYEQKDYYTTGKIHHLWMCIVSN